MMGNPRPVRQRRVVSLSGESESRPGASDAATRNSASSQARRSRSCVPVSRLGVRVGPSGGSGLPESPCIWNPDNMTYTVIWPHWHILGIWPHIPCPVIWGHTMIPSANRVTIIRDYVFFNRLYAIMHDYFRLYAIILLQKLERLYAIIALSRKRRLFHLFHYDYFTYFLRNILLRLLWLYAIMCIMFITSYNMHYFIWDELLRLFFSEPIMCIVRIIAPLELFFCLSIMTIVFFQFYYTHHVFPNTLFALLQLLVWRSK
jgi:hypothetical protein